MESREEFQAALSDVEERLAPLYRVRWKLRDAYTERYEGPELPRARDRSPTQEKVSRCPRCGHSLAESVPSAT